MWLGYLEILKICDKYKQKSILNLKDNKLHATSIAILAAFIKGNNIKRDQFICESNDVAKYLDTIGFYKEIWNETPSHRRINDGITYSPLVLLENYQKIDIATSTLNKCLTYMYPMTDKNSTSSLASLHEVVGELHDNIWSHGRNTGFSIAQKYGNYDPIIEIAVADCGIGFLNELINSKIPDIDNDQKAIYWCIQKGNSSKKFKEQNEDGWAQSIPEDIIGNPFSDIGIKSLVNNPNHHEGLGLSKLIDLVIKHKGEIQIISGRALLNKNFNNDTLTISNLPMNLSWKGVVIIFKLKTSNLKLEEEDSHQIDDLLNLIRT